jgi:hypothetical protein
LLLSSTNKCNFLNKRQKAFEGFLPFDKVVRSLDCRCKKKYNQLIFGQSYQFTNPYTSQHKGSVENRIGVIRRFFPKKTNLTFVTDKQVRDVEMKINNRPVRKFNYLLPNQVLQKKIALIT